MVFPSTIADPRSLMRTPVAPPVLALSDTDAPFAARDLIAILDGGLGAVPDLDTGFCSASNGGLADGRRGAGASDPDAVDPGHVDSVGSGRNLTARCQDDPGRGR